MRVKAYITFKGVFGLKYIGRVDKSGTFRFRNRQLRKACLNKLRETFHYDCHGGSLKIPETERAMKIAKLDGYITCYSSVIPEMENNKYIVTYWKN
jgi:hypothetical protein